MNEAKIVVENLTRKFSDITAVDDISMSIKKGDVLGFLGPNGAGKSTTMRVLSGFIEPTKGKALICGFDVVKEPIKVKEQIGYMPEGAPSYPEMNPLEFLEYVAKIRGIEKEKKDLYIQNAIKKAALIDVLDQPIETLSKGYKRRVGLAQAILHDPQILILDEPTEGLDPNQKHQVRKLINQIAKEKVIIISTHILEEVEAICNRVIIIDKGKIITDKTPQELKSLSKEHNDIVIDIKDEDKDKTISELNKLENVKSIKEKNIKESMTRLVIKPKEKNQDNALFIAKYLKDKNIKTKELFINQGSLEDVFRELTSSDVE